MHLFLTLSSVDLAALDTRPLKNDVGGRGRGEGERGGGEGGGGGM